MQISGIAAADFSLTNGKVPVWRIRSDETLTVDNETVQADDNGVSTVVLTASQSEALDALMASDDFDPTADEIELPDGASRGRQTVRGKSLADIIAARKAATLTPETPATGKATK